MRSRIIIVIIILILIRGAESTVLEFEHKVSSKQINLRLSDGGYFTVLLRSNLTKLFCRKSLVSARTCCGCNNTVQSTVQDKVLVMVLLLSIKYGMQCHFSPTETLLK